ncbi:PTS sugar transporter subunit IIB [Calorimonas adulescens]|jgi:PTS system, Lactose/Cellobiose specific IIB subunit.|uniref:PTS sugar transporter subunit IIB n=1 Tax=Calorimonas adulescens TaxID=2606906 RepID=A0A5D8QEN8_9THEO|nr:PTS sugar transporter subunit IIB [Calorimonas adulescens]TZE82972.1 PTS sugar transporter subunit IIB [Calorimonas adulescens]
MNILLVCSGGMSTSLLVNKMAKEGQKRGINGLKVEADSVDNLDKIIDKYDVVLLGPQVQYKEKWVKEVAARHGRPYAVIPPQVYGLVDGAKALDLALNTAKKE